MVIAEARAWLEAWFESQGVTYSHEQVGVFHVYYDFVPGVPAPPEVFTDT